MPSFGNTVNASQHEILSNRWWFSGQVEKIGDAPLLKVLEGLGAWPVVVDTWNGKGWKLEETLAKLRGLYNAPILVDSWVAADDKNSSLHVLQVSKPICCGMTLLHLTINLIQRCSHWAHFTRHDFATSYCPQLLNNLTAKYQAWWPHWLVIVYPTWQFHIVWHRHLRKIILCEGALVCISKD